MKVKIILKSLLWDGEKEHLFEQYLNDKDTCYSREPSMCDSGRKVRERRPKENKNGGRKGINVIKESVLLCLGEDFFPYFIVALAKITA